MKVEEENIREMEFGDAYDSIPAQVWPYLKWNWNDFFSSILFKWINNAFFRIETSSSLTLEHFMTSNRLTQIVTLPWSWQKSTNLVKCWSSKIQPSNNLGHQRMLPKKCLVLFYLYFHPFNRAHICILRQAVKCLSDVFQRMRTKSIGKQGHF